MDKKARKENYDLSISEFQARTKFLPYIISGISIIISLLAVYFSFKNTPDKIGTQKIPQQEKSTPINKTSHTKVTPKDTVSIDAKP